MPKEEELVGELLRGSGLTLSAAESCTGGNISHLITTVSGSSEYYLGSVTSYAISVKENLLGVPSETISTHGVVSSEVAAAMAEGVRTATGSTFAVATTGLAGKEGDGHYDGGTVWIAVTGPAGTRTLLYRHNGTRQENIENFSRRALEFLIDYIRTTAS